MQVHSGRGRLAGLASAVAITVLLAGAPWSASAAGKVAYQADFEDGKSDIQMVSGSGTAEIKSEGGNHYLQLTRNTTSADGYLHANFGPTVRDFDYSLRVKVTEYKSEDWNWGKILFRSQNTENESYICELWGWRANLVCKSVSQKIEEATKIKENQNVMFEQGKWHTLEIAARGSAITVFVDGRKALEMDNDTFPQGNFGFCSWGADLAVDDIRIVTYEDGKGPQPVSSLTTTAAPTTTTKAEAATTTQPATSTQAPSSGTAPGTAETTRGEETSPADGNSLPDDPSGSAAGTEPAEGGSAWWIILIVAAIVVVLAGGGVAAYMVIKNGGTRQE